jgi:diguanylate cyclase (GGDEF)-like protein/PAS domain S-box-containing protein
MRVDGMNYAQSQPAIQTAPTKWVLLASLLALGILGNYFKFPLFFEIDFLFGSIFSFLIFQLFDKAYGIAAALVVSVVTYFIWGHPYAVIIMTTEMVFVALLFRRYQISLVFADAAYWVLIGMPMVYFFYHGVMGVPEAVTDITLTKQAVNGITNVLLARLIFTLIGFRSDIFRITLREILHISMVLCVALPMLILIIIDSRSEFDKNVTKTQTDLKQSSLRINREIQLWIEDRATAVARLASVAALGNSTKTQDALDLLRSTDTNFLRLGFLNSDFITINYSPTVNEQGKSNIGVDFSDRPYVATLKEQAKPILSEVMMARLSFGDPIAVYVYPVQRGNEAIGYIAGVLSLQKISQLLTVEDSASELRFTLIDKTGKVIVTNREDQKPLSPFLIEEGDFKKIDDSVAQWFPKVRANTPFYERFRKSYYVNESALGGFADWRLIIEQPIGPMQKALSETYAKRLTLLMILLLVGICLAEFFSRQMMKVFNAIQNATANLPARLASGHSVLWPESQMVEIQNLISNFQIMASSLQIEFESSKATNSRLESRVAERTQDLERLNSDFIALLENTSDFIYCKDLNLSWRFCSQPYAELAGVSSWRDLIGKTNRDIFHAEILESVEAEDREVLRTGKPILGIIDRAIYPDGREIWTSMNKWPLFDPKGHIIGVFGIHRDISKQKQADDDIKRLAFYDTLTNLPNRRLLLDRLEQALASFKRTGQFGALVFIDLDNFKYLNDTRGHLTGDLLLVQVAQRLTHCFRDEDTVARIGGDEFVVMLQNLGKSESKAALAVRNAGEKVLVELNKAYLLDGQEHFSSPSIGIALFEEDVTNLEDLLKRADLAMYKVKATGRNAMMFFDAQMQKVTNARISIEQDLRFGLSNGQLCLYFQPQIHGVSKVIGAEALLRWLHPTRGMVPPIEFIPLAEETQLIVSIGDWVLERACDQILVWSKSPDTEHLLLSVNVSARQFNMPNFFDKLEALLLKTGANPARLILEITESLLLTDMEKIIERMQALKALGIGFSLDDFGTGYSSLSYLKRMPLNQLKIDKSFVRDINTDVNDIAIIQAIISMGRALDIHVIAEGVEDSTQLNALAGLGCEYFQGYLFGRPETIEKFEFALRNS